MLDFHYVSFVTNPSERMGTMNSPNANTTRNLWVCEVSETYLMRGGIFFGISPLDFILPVLCLQIFLATLLTAFLQLLLTPLGEVGFIPQMLAGMLLGPSVLGQIEPIKNVFFPQKSFYVSETIAFFGCMLFMFLVGVKMDPTAITRSGKKAWAIGICAFFVPLISSTILASILRNLISMEQDLKKSLFYIAFFLSNSSFHVIACLLADLKLLNSELGQLASSSSMISGMISLIWVTALFTCKQSYLNKDNSFIWMILCLLVMVASIVFILRPIMLWMIRKTPEGKPIKESYVFSVFLMVLGCAIFGECIGQHFMIGPILLGLAIPDGPPLGSALVEKLDTYVTNILLPLYFLYSGAKFNFSVIQVTNFGVVELLALCSLGGKVIGTMLPSLYCKMPPVDAFCLGLIMSAQGITDVLFIQVAVFLLLIDGQSYSIMVVSTVLLTGTVSPIVKILYDPSKRYLSSNRKRTIEHATPNAELRLLACLHYEESTPAIINLLEMSNPTHQSPICFYVMHLVQLIGRSSPILVAHHRGKSHTMHNSQSNHIINAFRLYEQHHPGKLLVNLFTSVSPYNTMHDEICMLAADKRASMVIMPFHRQWTKSGITESGNPIRALNRHMLRIAPCSVAILVERGTMIVTNSMACISFYSVGMIFVEGPDDREALAYTMRMAEHPGTRVTLIRLVHPQSRKSKISVHRDQDFDIIHKFKLANIQIKRHDYREEIVSDSVEMINVIRSLENSFDLIVVGRRHASDTPLFMGLTEWNEYPELGFLGDMLVSSDSHFDASVLVVQQQRLGGNDHVLLVDHNIKCVVEVAPNSNRAKVGPTF